MIITKFDTYSAHVSAVLEDGCRIGGGCHIWHFAHIRTGATIGRDCVIGKDVFIDEGVVIGDRVKIQNGVSIYKGVTVESDVFIGPHVAFTNDLRPRASGEHWRLATTLLRKGCSIGANSTIVAGIHICEWAMVGAGSVVTRTVPRHRLVVGNPAIVRAIVCECGWTLGRTPDEYLLTQASGCGQCGRPSPALSGDTWQKE